MMIQVAGMALAVAVALALMLAVPLVLALPLCVAAWLGHALERRRERILSPSAPAAAPVPRMQLAA